MVTTLEHLGRNLWLKIKAVRTNLDTFDDVGTKRLVAGFHIRQRGVVQHVGMRVSTLLPK